MVAGTTPAQWILDWVREQPEGFQISLAQYTFGILGARDELDYDPDRYGVLEPIARLIVDARQDPTIAVGLALHLRAAIQFCLWSHARRELDLQRVMSRAASGGGAAVARGLVAARRVDEWGRLAQSWQEDVAPTVTDEALDRWLSGQ